MFVCVLECHLDAIRNERRSRYLFLCKLTWYAQRIITSKLHLVFVKINISRCKSIEIIGCHVFKNLMPNSWSGELDDLYSPILYTHASGLTSAVVLLKLYVLAPAFVLLERLIVERGALVEFYLLTTTHAIYLVFGCVRSPFIAFKQRDPLLEVHILSSSGPHGLSFSFTRE